MKLTKTEEIVMEIIWKEGKAFMKDILDHYPEPKPAPSTVATLLKRMQQKGFVGFTLYGNSREYYPLVKKSDYFAKHMKGIVKNYFENSSLKFASFFTRTSNFSNKELEELKKIIDDQIKKNTK